MRKKATIYPYSKKDVQFFRYASLLGEIEPVFAVSPPGWGFCGFDATEIDGGKASGLKITEDLSEALRNSELLILTSFDKYYGKEGGLKDTIEIAIQMKMPFMLYFRPDKIEDRERRILDEAKQLGLLSKISDKFEDTEANNAAMDVDLLNNILDKIKDREAINGILDKAKHLGLFRNIPDKKMKISKYLGINYCKKLNSPTTLILGQGPNSGKFETQMGLRKELLQRGFKISQIGTRPYCELFGFHSFPAFMLNKELDETEKIISFNHFIKNIEEEEKPDLIIVGIPGGIMPVVDKIHNNYGILHVEVASALEPDALIYNLYSNHYTKQYYDTSAEFVYHRFNNTLPACFMLTNLWVDYNAIVEHDMFHVVTLDKMYDQVVEKPGKDIPVVSILEPGAFTKVADATISILESYGSVDTF
jgi:peptide maturation system protein (TIGR04066 family)